MENLLTLALEAHNGDRNHHRRYEFHIGCDLFATWTLSIRYGRVGTPLREENFSSHSPEDIKRIAADRLRQRANARRRFGTDYTVVEMIETDGTAMDDWLPHAALTPLFPSRSKSARIASCVGAFGILLQRDFVNEAQRKQANTI